MFRPRAFISIRAERRELLLYNSAFIFNVRTDFRSSTSGWILKHFKIYSFIEMCTSSSSALPLIFGLTKSSRNPPRVTSEAVLSKLNDPKSGEVLPEKVEAFESCPSHSNNKISSIDNISCDNCHQQQLAQDNRQNRISNHSSFRIKLYLILLKFLFRRKLEVTGKSMHWRETETQLDNKYPISIQVV